jgi:hypothetical protein
LRAFEAVNDSWEIRFEQRVFRKLEFGIAGKIGSGKDECLKMQIKRRQVRVTYLTPPGATSMT